MDGCRVQYLGLGWHQIPLHKAFIQGNDGQGAHKDTLSPSTACSSHSLLGFASLFFIKGRLTGRRLLC